MTCEDCIHHDLCVCVGTRKLYPGSSEGCRFFSVKTRFVELPCKLGDPVYIIVYLKNKIPSHIVQRTITGIHITEKVFGFRGEKSSHYLVTNTDIGFAQHIPFREIGKSVFLTHEEAKVALTERKVSQ